MGTVHREMMMMKMLGQDQTMIQMRIIMTMASTTVNLEVKTTLILRNQERGLKMMAIVTERGTKAIIEMVRSDTKVRSVKISLERRLRQDTRCRLSKQETAN